ncbi:MAG: tetratricopeptide repeat protein, partial [Candidatus Wallbacteria bacterium]|nr:tetratricopeptide repeat protein [Candidatus Wallbacteria bacterium]
MTAIGPRRASRWLVASALLLALLLTPSHAQETEEDDAQPDVSAAQTGEATAAAEPPAGTPEATLPAPEASPTTAPADSAPEISIATSPAEPDGSTAWRTEKFFGQETWVPREPAERVKLLEAAKPGAAASLELATVLASQGDFARAQPILEKRVKDAASPETRGRARLDLADLMHRQLHLPEEVLALRTALQEVPVEARPALYDRIFSVVEIYRVPQFDTLMLLQERVAAFPGDWPATKALLDFQLRNGSVNAMAGIDAALPKFRDHRRELLEMKRGLLLKDGKAEAVRQAYLAAAVPAPGAELDAEVLDDLLEVLRHRREVEPVRRRLEALERAGRLTPQDVVLLVWILASENRGDEASKALEGLAAPVRRALGRDTMGQLFSKLGRTAQAAKLYLGAYLEAKEPAAREGALYHFAGALRAQPAALPQLAPDPARALAAPGRVDGNPGYVSGLLSLVFNATHPGARLASLGSAARAWTGRGALWGVAAAYASEFPSSERGQEVFLFAMDDLGRARQHELVSALIQKRLDSLKPASALAFGLKLRQAAALRSASKRQGAWAIYRELLAGFPRSPAAAAPETLSRYWKVFDLLAASLAEDGRHEDVLRLYWDELGRRPSDAALYQKFLAYLTTYKLVEAELKVYEKAIQSFKDPSWSHKLARWYLRHKRKDAYQKLAYRVMGLFGGSQLRQFLGEFAHLGYGRGADDPDNRLALALYKDALARHPHELAFVTRLERFYRARKMETELDALLSRYYFSAPELAERWLRDLARRGQLDAKLQAAGSPALGASTLYERFVADARSRRCEFEQALPLYQKALARYPGDRWLTLRVASLLRSLGRPIEAAQLLARLIAAWPDDAELLTLRGELLIEAGDADGAVSSWNRLVETRPGDSARYLEAATVFWDYFDYGRAASLLEECRRVTGEPATHAVRLAAVHESAGAPEKAIEEYIRQLWLVDLYDFEARRRLVYLSRAKKMKPLVAGRFAALMTVYPDDARLVTACAEWLDLLEDADGKARLYLEAAAKYRDIDLLETIGNYFEATGASDGSEKALGRLLEVSGGERDYRLRLAALQEQRGERDLARSTLEQGVELGRKAEVAGEGPTQAIASLLDLASYQERQGLLESLFSTLADAEHLASGERRREIRQRLGRLLLANNREPEARRVFLSMLADDPLEPDSFAELAGLALKSKDASALTTLYEGAIQAVRKSALPAPDRKARVLRLREDLAAHYLALGKPADALDQWIEVVNREPGDERSLAKAYEVATAGKLLTRLEGYYRKTSEKSFKDYRWNVVLARISELDGRSDEAASQYAKAIANEPHRPELYRARADDLVKAGKYREAADVFRDLYRLDNRDTSWLEKVALMFARSGDMQRARQELEAFVKLGAQDAGSHLAAARVYDAWGLAAEALKESREAVALERDAWRSRDVNGYLVADALALIGRWDGGAAALAAALDLRGRFEELRGAAGNNHVQEARLREAAGKVERFVSDRLPGIVQRYSSDGDASALATAASTAARADANLVPELIKFAEAARLYPLQKDLMELAITLPAPQNTDPAEALRQMLARRLARGEEAAFIRQRLLSVTDGGRHASLLLRLAVLARLEGDTSGEQAALAELMAYTQDGHSFYH